MIKYCVKQIEAKDRECARPEDEKQRKSKENNASSNCGGSRMVRKDESQCASYIHPLSPRHSPQATAGLGAVSFLASLRKAIFFGFDSPTQLKIRYVLSGKPTKS